MLPPLNNESFIIKPNFVTVAMLELAHIETANSHFQNLISPPFRSMLFLKFAISSNKSTAVDVKPLNFSQYSCEGSAGMTAPIGPHRPISATIHRISAKRVFYLGI